MDDFTRLTTLMEASGVKRSVREVPKMPSEEQLRREYAPTIMGSLQEGRRQAAEGIQTLAAGIGKGVSLGLTDHIAAKVLQYTRAAQGGLRDPQNTYENALRDVREENKRMETQRPVAYGTGQVAGGAMLLPGFAGATVPAAATRTAIMGGIQGGAGAETLGEIPQEAAIGAGIGAATGGTLAGAGKLASKGINIAAEKYTRNKLASDIEDMIRRWDRGGKREYEQLVGLTQRDVKDLQRSNPNFKDELINSAKQNAESFRNPSTEIAISPKSVQAANTFKEAVELAKSYPGKTEQIITNASKKMGYEIPYRYVDNKKVFDPDLIIKDVNVRSPTTVKQSLSKKIEDESLAASQGLPIGIAKGITYGTGAGTLGMYGAPLLGLDPMIGASLGLLGGGAVGAKQAVTQYGINRALNKGAQQVLRGQPTLPQVMPIAETAARAGTMMTVPTANEFYNPRVDEQEVSRIEELLRRPKFVAED